VFGDSAESPRNNSWWNPTSKDRGRGRQDEYFDSKVKSPGVIQLRRTTPSIHSGKTYFFSISPGRLLAGSASRYIQSLAVEARFVWHCHLPSLSLDQGNHWTSDCQRSRTGRFHFERLSRKEDIALDSLIHRGLSRATGLIRSRKKTDQTNKTNLDKTFGLGLSTQFATVPGPPVWTFGK
jgi:hypothetical protein